MVLTFVLMLLVALVAAVFRSEFEAWMPWVAERLRRLALRPLKGDLRDRLDEEWAAYLADVPGFVGKVVCALGLNWASRQIYFERNCRRYLSALLLELMKACFRGSTFATASGRWMSRRRWLFSKQVEETLARCGFGLLGSGLMMHAHRINLITDPDKRESALVAYAQDLRLFTASMMEAAKAADRGEPPAEFSLTLTNPEN